MTRERGRMRLPSLHGLFQKVRLWNVLDKALRRLWEARPGPQAWGFCKPDRRVSQKKATARKRPPSPAGQRQRIKAPLSCSLCLPTHPPTSFSLLPLPAPLPASSSRFPASLVWSLPPAPHHLPSASETPTASPKAPCLCRFCSLCLELLSPASPLDPGLARRSQLPSLTSQIYQASRVCQAPCQGSASKC